MLSGKLKLALWTPICVGNLKLEKFKTGVLESMFYGKFKTGKFETVALDTMMSILKMTYILT